MKIDFTFRGEISTDVISENMFGGNLLFKYDTISGSGSTFVDAIKEINMFGIRFPGGAMTEINFDVNNPDAKPLGASGDAPFVGLTEFLKFAEKNNQPVDIVIPTRGMYQGAPDPGSNNPREIYEAYVNSVLDYIRRLLKIGDQDSDSLPDAKIDSIEIGNEYWGSGKMTATEYGQIINELLPKIQQIIDAEFPATQEQPKIIVQMGAPVDAQFKEGLYSGLSFAQKLAISNKNIIDQITDPIARSAIDGLVTHYYYGTPDDILVRNTWTMQSLDSTFDIWRSNGFGDREYQVTEWNVALGNPSQLGLKGASILIEQFSYMVEVGVDAAFVWPVQGFSNGLFKKVDDEIKLSPIGAAFKLMAASLVGKKLSPFEIQSKSIEAEVFTSDTQVVIFMASRSSEELAFEVDISEVIPKYNFAYGNLVGVKPGTSVSDPDALAVETDLAASQFLSDRKVELSLKPFEFVRLVFDTTKPKHVFGSIRSDQIFGASANDTLAGGLGNDTISGFGGDDQVFGGAGADKLLGGGGRDVLDGGIGDDTIFGGEGADVIHGRGGRDVLYAVSGRDTVYGGMGPDSLFGGKDGAALWGELGDDTVIGSGGDDQIFGGSGADRLLGGSGNDEMDGGAGDDTIFGGGGVDSIFGGDGRDVLYAVSGQDTLYGGIGPDSLFGGRDGSVLWGDTGNDTIYGFGGDDTLIGGAGSDVLFGGEGADVFAFEAIGDFSEGAYLIDRVMDFTRADHDTIKLTSIDASVSEAGDQAFSWISDRGFSGIPGELRYSAAAKGWLLVEGDTDGDGLADFSIEVYGVRNLTSSDFLL